MRDRAGDMQRSIFLCASLGETMNQEQNTAMTDFTCCRFGLVQFFFIVTLHINTL